MARAFVLRKDLVMAVSKIWAVHKNVGSSVEYIENPDKTFDKTENLYSDFEDTLGYVIEPVKTDNGRLVYGLNCDALKAEEEFLKVKRDFDNEGSIQAYHGYISFSPQDNITANDALTIGKKIAEEMWGERFQVAMAVHTNTDNLHMHFLVNSVSFIDGKKARDDEKNYRRLRAITDRICQEYGLSVLNAVKSDIAYTNSQVIKDVLEATMESSEPEVIQERLKAKGYRILKRDHIKTPDGRILNIKDLDDSLTVTGYKKKASKKDLVDDRGKEREDRIYGRFGIYKNGR